MRLYFRQFILRTLIRCPRIYFRLLFISRCFRRFLSTSRFFHVTIRRSRYFLLHFRMFPTPFRGTFNARRRRKSNGRHCHYRCQTSGSRRTRGASGHRYAKRRVKRTINRYIASTISVINMPTRSVAILVNIRMSSERAFRLTRRFLARPNRNTLSCLIRRSVFSMDDHRSYRMSDYRRRRSTRRSLGITQRSMIISGQTGRMQSNRINHGTSRSRRASRGRWPPIANRMQCRT